MNSITLSLTEKQFLVFYEFLYNLKLGDYSEFATEMSDLAIELEAFMSSTALHMMEHKHGKPDISVMSTQLDGMEFLVN